MTNNTQIHFAPAWLVLSGIVLRLLYPFLVVWAAIQLVTILGPHWMVLAVLLLLVWARPTTPPATP